MYCLICHNQIEASVTWTSVFTFKEHTPLCQKCTSEFEPIHSPTCPYCSRDDVPQCFDCSHWEPENLLIKNRAVFRYNHFLKEVIYRFKYRGDYQLVESFGPLFRARFKEAFDSLPKTTRLVPIPLSEARLKARAFNQAEALAKLLPFETVELLRRTSGEKQAKKNRRARLAMENPFELTRVDEPSPVIIIDDIYTTGATIHHAARVLKENGYDEVASFTLGR